MIRSSRLAVGTVVAVVIIAFTAAALPVSLGWVSTARNERDAVDQRLASVKSVLELLVEAETGERGYVITGREAFLQPYHNALSDLPVKVQSMELLYDSVSDSKKQLIRDLVRASRRRMDGLSEIVGVRQESGFTAAEPFVSSGHGKSEMDKVRSLAGQLSVIETRELATLNAALDHKIWWSILISLCSTVLTLALLAYLARMMMRAVRTGEAAALQAQQTSEQLAAGMESLKRRNEEVSALGEMSRLLQAEMSLVEALEVTSLFARRLLPGTSGSVYLFRNSADILELAASWGESASDENRILEPTACWGIRRGHTHRQVHSSDLRCRHCPAPADTGGASDHNTCLPLTAYGEVLGLMHVRGVTGRATDAHLSADMAQAISEQVALALSNAKLRQVLRDQSIRDPLTGWYNRRYMEETLARELARAHRTTAPLSIVIADLDHFKNINDAHGHPAGDAVLRAVTRLLSTMVRESDVACRFGGEEFVLILPECTREGAVRKAQAMCDALRAMVVRDDSQAIAVTASFGVASAPDDGSDATALFAVADAALYRAKEGGRDRVGTALLPVSAPQAISTFPL